MSNVSIDRFELEDPTHGAVPCVSVAPLDRGDEPLPLVLFLYGGGGSEETLAQLAPFFEAAWREHAVPAMRVASARVPPFGFYLDDQARGLAWETLVAERLPKAVASRFAVRSGRDARGLVGISMGGYGALKIAFARPGSFGAVAAIAPMVEPVLAPVPLRNRFHYPADVPAALLGDDRDAALYERDHPAMRARRHAVAIRASDLAVWIDGGSRDALNAHDGAESLHRVLWDLDVRHEYHLLRDADHVGPTIVPRLRRAFAWVGEHIDGRPRTELSAEEVALRAFVEPQRGVAMTKDPSMARAYGRVDER